MIYDLIQRLAGSRQGLAVLREEISRLSAGGKVLDIGGGTGAVRHLFGRRWDYIGLEPDPNKLEVFRRKHPATEVWEASADHIPCEGDRFDLCLLIAVAHHMNADQLCMSLGEIRRVLRPSGKLLLLDPLWEPTNLPGRALWWIDRGAYPRTATDLQEILSKNYFIESIRHYRIFHDYFLAWATKTAVPPSQKPQTLQTA